MHPVTTMKHWSHHISEHLHSRHFWAGVGITVLAIGLVTLVVLVAKNTPIELQSTHPYTFPYGP